MDFKKVIMNLEVYNSASASSYFAIEALLLELLKAHIASQGKPFTVNQRIGSNFKFELDGYAEKGFDDYTGATGIEIKLIRNSSSLKTINKRIIERVSKINKLADTPIIENLLILTTIALDDEDRTRLKSIYTDLSFRFDIWDINQIQKLIDKYPQLTSEFKSNPSKLLVKQLVKDGFTDPVDKWKVKKENHILDLKKCFLNDNLVLFLGAGISLDAGIPTWNTLMSKLMVTLLNKVINNEKAEGQVDLSEIEKNALVDAIQRRNGSSPLQLVRFIRNGLGDIFQNELRKVLYNDCNGRSRILEAITDLSIPLRHGVGVQGIVTYNFDDLLEVNFKMKKVIRYHSVFQEADIPAKNELGIFHVHGFLPRKVSDDFYDEVQEQESILVFSEEKYHELFIDDYHWANLVQLNYFRERTCLFIGASMTDPNVRRLLEIARQKQAEQDECKHYIILKRDSFSDIQGGEGIDVSQIEKFATVHQKLKEAELRELGLNVIWVDGFDEIPSLLDKLRN